MGDDLRAAPKGRGGMSVRDPALDEVRSTTSPLGNQRKARDSNPHSQWETALAVRPGQPYPATFLLVNRSDQHEWTTGESNPDSPGCRPGVVPLDQQPILGREQGPPENRTRSPSLQGKDAASALADHRASLMSRVVPEGVEPPFPLCKRGVVAIGPRDVSVLLLLNSTGGIRTHRHETLSLIAMPVRVPCRPASMSQAPVSSRASQPYESRSDACHAWVLQLAVLMSLSIS